MLFIVASETDIRLPLSGLSNKHREKTPSLYSVRAGRWQVWFRLLLWEGRSGRGGRGRVTWGSPPHPDYTTQEGGRVTWGSPPCSNHTRPGQWVLTRPLVWLHMSHRDKRGSPGSRPPVGIWFCRVSNREETAPPAIIRRKRGWLGLAHQRAQGSHRYPTSQNPFLSCKGDKWPPSSSFTIYF